MLRDQTRPDFVIYTGNDLAIDMVMYGSDYLLGLSAFGPDYFKQRDRAWQQQDERFYEINDCCSMWACWLFATGARVSTFDGTIALLAWFDQHAAHPSTISESA